MSYNYVQNCFVPSCSNNSKTFPDIKFIVVPYTSERIRWFEAVGKSVDCGVNRRSTYYCCQAHFDMDSDTWSFKRKDGQLGYKVKPGVVPFLTSPFLLNSNYSKKPLRQIIDEMNTKSTQTDYTICNEVEESQEVQFPYCNIKEENSTEEDGAEQDAAEVDTAEDVESTAPQNITNIPDLCTEEIKLETDLSFDEDSIDSFHDYNNTTVEFSPLSMTLMIMNRRPRHYMGINNSLHVILHLTKVTNLPEEKIMLTLRKIKLNEEFQTLADSFDIEKESAEEYFRDSIVPLSSYLKNFMKYETPKVIVTKQMTSLGIHIQQHKNKLKYDRNPNIVIASKFNEYIHLVVQIVCGLANLQHKLQIT